MGRWISTDPLLTLAPGGLHQVDGVAGNPGMVPLRGPGLVAWWDACRPGALEAGDRVSSWPDLSGHGWSLDQSTDAARPTWVDVARNGRPVLRFDGGDYLYRAQSAGPTLDLRYLSIFVALSMTADRDYAGYVILCPATGNDYQTPDGVAVSASTTVQSLNCTINSQAASKNISTSVGWNVFGVRVNATNRVLTSLATVLTNRTFASAPSDSAQVGLLVGARFISGAPTVSSNDGVAADIGEVIIYNSVLSPRHQAEVVAYLGRKWGLTL